MARRRDGLSWRKVNPPAPGAATANGHGAIADGPERGSTHATGGCFPLGVPQG